MNTRNVTVDPWSVDPDGIPGTALDACLRAAIAAPSIFNSQPWRFDPGHGFIDLYADRGASFPSSTPVAGSWPSVSAPHCSTYGWPSCATTGYR